MSNSNAPKGYPTLNDQGYELFYALDGNGVPTLTPPRLIFDGQTFLNVQEINEYRARLQKNKDNSAKESLSVDLRGVGYPVMQNPEETLRGWLTETDDHRKWYMLSQAEHYALQNLGWSRATINRHITMHNQVGYYPDGWLGSLVQKIREP
jgi:hypothetical protein